MEFELLRVFLANPNRVLSRDQLLMHTRNREWEPFDRSIDIRIGRLRRKVEPDPGGEPRTIRTVRNAGYMFVPDRVAGRPGLSAPRQTSTSLGKKAHAAYPQASPEGHVKVKCSPCNRNRRSVAEQGPRIRIGYTRQGR
jgi:DNA-binding winged helix-turn-helix (wHTH) protein